MLLEDQRSALASVLLLQEMGFSVDVSAQPDAALSWIQLARYEWIVCSGGERTSSADFLLRLRYATPHARVLVIGGSALAGGRARCTRHRGAARARQCEPHG